MAKKKNVIPKLDPKTDGASQDIVSENIAVFKALFPEMLTDGKIDFDALKLLLGDEVEPSDERYGLQWHGKARAKRIAQTLSTGTLRPCEDESVNWDTTQNVFIEGDNLEVLKLLQKSYHRRVKMIYIDPPYNTGKEFIYPDKYQDNLETYLKYTGQLDGEGFKLSANAESGGRYHTNWLNMMYPRLRLAKNLLRDDGVIFVSIDDNESAGLRFLMNEIFGDENFVGNIVWNHTKQSKNDEEHFSRHHNQILCYRKTDALERFRFPRTEEDNQNYSNPDADPKGDWRPGDVRSPSFRATLRYNVTSPNGKKIAPPDMGWRWSEETLKSKIATGEVVFSADGTRIIRKIYLSEQEGRTPENLWLAELAGTTRQANAELKELFDGEPPFDTPKPVSLIDRLLHLGATGDAPIVMDFFAGSGTTGHAVMSKNHADNAHRRYILVQLPEGLNSDDPAHNAAREICESIGKPATIAEIAKERIRRAAVRLRAGAPLLSCDFGFRVFKLDSSNIKEWDGDPDVFGNRTLEEAADNLKPDRSQEDLLYELLLKFGLDLAVPIESRTIKGKCVYVIGDGALVVCFEEKLKASVVEGIAALRAELSPEIMRVVFRDSCFADDVAKTNAVQILRQSGIEDIKSL